MGENTMKANKKISAILNDPKNQITGYHIGDKKVSEAAFFRQVKKDLAKGRGEAERKKSFYWTDQKVMLLLECMNIKVSQDALNLFKKQF